MTLSRRSTLLAGLAAPLVLRHARAETVVKMGTLKLIHALTPYFYQQFAPPGVTIEVIPFESPADGKTAVVSKSVDFGTFGIAASILAAVAHEPLMVVGSVCNKGMGIVAGKNSGIDTLKDLKGKKVAIWPGSTQEVFVLERLHMEGMSVKDITPVRVSFSEMHAALARGDVDAYVGAEPGPSISITSGIGKIVEYPYSTPMGGLNMVLATHAETVKTKPELVRAMVEMQRKAAEFGNTHADAMTSMAVGKLGQKPDVVAASLPNVQLTWQMTPEMVGQCKSYAEHMLELKQIRTLPDFAFLDAKFSDEVGKTA